MWSLENFMKRDFPFCYFKGLFLYINDFKPSFRDNRISNRLSISLQRYSVKSTEDKSKRTSCISSIFSFFTKISSIWSYRKYRLYCIDIWSFFKFFCFLKRKSTTIDLEMRKRERRGPSREAPTPKNTPPQKSTARPPICSKSTSYRSQWTLITRYVW